MRKTGIVADPRYIEHITGDYHPEHPERLMSIYRMLEDEGLRGKCQSIEPRECKIEELELIHQRNYIDIIAETKGRYSQLDPDTSASPKSYEIARLAVGGLLNAIDRVMKGSLDNAFAIIRPPGHHAERARAMGFCLFNNIAIGARYALREYRLNQILIVDWDLHHGNGTQHAFYDEPEVLYFSTHQYPYYPGSGDFGEVGAGKGEGFTVNIPLIPGQGDAEFVAIFDRILKPIALSFKPQLVLVSAGFDTYFKDPLGGMKLTEEGFANLTRIVLEIAQSCCGGKAVFALEGGYHLDGLAQSVKMVLKALLGEELRLKDLRECSQFTQRLIDAVIKLHKKYWPLPG